MLLNFWSIGLLLVSSATIFLAGGALTTAIKILRFWDPEVDTARQIQLENETWLSAMLMEYGMVLQLAGLLLLVTAADAFSEILVGAMCATGAFLANGYGTPLLLLRIVGIFLYGFWIVLHRLDISSENLPLTRVKYIYLLLLVPLLITDLLLLLSYLLQLEPDIITSCCGVVFGNGGGDGTNLIGPMPVGWVMTVFYSLALFLLAWSVFILQRGKRWGALSQLSFWGKIRSVLFALLWLIFFAWSLLVITSVISSYIYAMPFHRCPFDILRKEYYWVGYPIYATLFGATFSGMSAGLTTLLASFSGLEESISTFQRAVLRFCLLFFVVFLLLVSWFPLVYLLGADIQ